LSPDGRTPPVGVAVGPDGELALDLYALSRAHDLRQPVLRTLLTYLELDGHLRQLTPAYAGYRVRRLGAGAGDQAGYRAGDLPGWLAGAVLDRASFGRSWWSLDAEEVAGELGVGRSEVVEALDGLAATGGWEVKPSGLRHRYAVGRAPEDPGALAASLQAQMLDREVAEVGRIRAVVELVMEPGCQANRLSAYFGQPREEPCGACSSCAGVVRQLPEPDGIAPPVTAEEVAGIEAGLAALRAEHPAALGAHRQATRFLCGVSSPALSAARLHKHSLYGVFAGRRFHEVHAAVRGSG
jgi:ATP-dependent DNA helicase RecQ